MSASSTLSLPPPPPPPLRPFSVDEYHRMIQAGILTEDDNVELLEGWIVQKMPRNPRHDCTLSCTHELLGRHLPEGWIRRAQCAITLPDSEPEPDIAVARGQNRSFLQRHPGPGDLGAVVEVSDSSLDHDRLVKSRIYARARIPVYWIINLPDSQIEVYTDPTGPDPAPRYRTRQDFRIGDAVPLVLDGQPVAAIPVRDLLP